jgi:tripartite-type tricarboxylate transporter receptor subunit TctC
MACQAIPQSCAHGRRESLRAHQPIIDKLTAEIAKLMATPAFKQKAAELGATAQYMSPQA